MIVTEIAPMPAPVYPEREPVDELRVVDRPDIAGYRVSGCVDFIELTFTVPRVRSVYALQPVFGSGSWVAAQGQCRTRGTSFRATIQEPKTAMSLMQKLSSIDATNVSVTCIEVAVDFYPITPEGRAAMPILAAHLLRGMKNPQDFARFCKKGPGCQEVFSFQSSIRSFTRGETCCLGHRGDQHRQRLYVKTTDHGGVPLQPIAHRVRVENTYIFADGQHDLLGQGLHGVIGRDDFAFMKLTPQESAIQRLLAARVAQAGTRAPRAGRLLFAANTVADTELNRRVQDALRSLIHRWAEPSAPAENAGHTQEIPLGKVASSSNYTSVIPEVETREEKKKKTKNEPSTTLLATPMTMAIMEIWGSKLQVLTKAAVISTRDSLAEREDHQDPGRVVIVIPRNTEFQRIPTQGIPILPIRKCEIVRAVPRLAALFDQYLVDATSRTMDSRPPSSTGVTAVVDSRADSSKEDGGLGRPREISTVGD